MTRKAPITELDCRTAESMVARYINHTLKTDELEEFLDHIEHCSSCYDELETYFIVNKVTQQLVEQEDGCVLDFQNLLEQDIRKSRRYIHHKRYMQLDSSWWSRRTAVFWIFRIFWNRISESPEDISITKDICSWSGEY